MRLEKLPFEVVLLGHTRHYFVFKLLNKFG